MRQESVRNFPHVGNRLFVEQDRPLFYGINPQEVADVRILPRLCAEPVRELVGVRSLELDLVTTTERYFHGHNRLPFDVRVIPVYRGSDHANTRLFEAPDKGVARPQLAGVVRPPLYSRLWVKSP